jgi:hypothetical protein
MRMKEEISIDNKKILKYSLVALIAAIALLFTFILPAEYGIDPLGTGSMLGLISLSEEPNTEKFMTVIPQNSKYLEDKAEIKLLPRQGVEYKYQMEEGAVMLYSWISTNPLPYDFHGEPRGAQSGYFESFEVSEGNQSNGAFIAPFSGTHGWFWENRGSEPVTITLATSGYFEIIGNPRKGR